MLWEITWSTQRSWFTLLHRTFIPLLILHLLFGWFINSQGNLKGYFVKYLCSQTWQPSSTVMCCSISCTLLWLLRHRWRALTPHHTASLSWYRERRYSSFYLYNLAWRYCNKNIIHYLDLTYKQMPDQISSFS